MTTDHQHLADSAVFVDTARSLAARHLVTVVDGETAAFILEDGQSVHEINLAKHADVPTRASGAVQLTDADSLVTYVNRHSWPRATTLWASETAAKVVAVLNDHERKHVDAVDGDDPTGESLPGWGDHRAALQLQHTPDWLHWLKYDGKLLPQEPFAEHLEDGADAILDPAAATMLEVAQSFHAKRGVSYTSSRHLGGEVEFGFEETVQARAGQKGKLEVPATFTLGLVPFDGGGLYEIKARLRFRLNDGVLSLGYRLIRPDRVRRLAFTDLIGRISDGTGLPVMLGTPR